MALLFAGTACQKEFETVLNMQRSTDTDVSEYLPQITYGSVKLGTFNLLYGSYDKTDGYTWDVRKGSLTQAIIANDFDVFGIQEADKVIRENLPTLVKEALPAGSTRNYEWWFVCRDNQAATTGEALGLVYDSNKYSISNQHYFWLTDKDPDTMNYGWDETSYHRMAACATFTDVTNPAKQFFVMVTHAPLASVARLGSASLISERAAMYNPSGLPAFLVGDMNAAPDDPATAVYLQGKEPFKWNDAYAKVPAAARMGGVITFHGKKEIGDVADASNRIDYIYYKNLPKVLTYKVDYSKYNGYYPSDHCPVSVTFDIPEKEAATLSGTGTEADPYVIASEADWEVAAQLVGAGEAQAHFVLTANLDFNWKTFTRMESFEGTLNGAGHKMVGITGEAAAENFGGVVNVLDAGGVIKDLHVEATLSSAFKNLGGVVGSAQAGSLIDGVTFRGNLTGSGDASRIGGIAGTGYGVIVNCGCLGGEFNAATATKSENMGGIAGRIEQPTAMMFNCYSFVDKIISSQNNLGGVTGGLGTDAYCANVYGITTEFTTPGTTYGGCIGYSKSGNIRNVYTSEEAAFNGTSTKWVANDKQASDWVTTGAALSLANMKSGAVTLPSSGVSYNSFVEALNAGIADWNALPSVAAKQGKDAPAGIVNKPDVTLRAWVVGENGYPVVSASAVTPDPGPGTQPGPIGDPIETKIVFKDYALDHGWIVGTDTNPLTQVYTEVKQGDVTITAGGNEGESNGVYNSPSYYDWRFYQARGGFVVISVPDGYQLVGVTFDYYEYKNGGLMLDPDGNQCLDEAEVTVSGQSAKFVVGNQGTATNGQARILGIKVKYVRWGVPEIGSNKVVSVNFDKYGPEKSWENGNSYETVSVGDVTLTASWEGGSSNGVYYVGDSPTRDDWRFYQARKGGLTISVPAGHTLVRAKFTYTNKNGGVIIAPDGTTTVPSGTDCSISGQSVLFTVGSPTADNGQARINEIEIEYK